MFGLSNFAGGVQDELKDLLVRRFLEQTKRQELAQAQQKIDQEARRDATAQEVAYGRLGLDRDTLTQRGKEFDTTAGFKGRELSLDEGMQPVRIKHTEAQTSELARRPQAEREEREHDMALAGTRHRQNMTEIGAQGAEQRRTAAVRLAQQTQPTSTTSDFGRERQTRMRDAIAAIRPNVSRKTAGVGSLLADIPETGARNLRAQLESLKSNVAFNELQEMRNASKTGGALGQVSDKENAMLAAALGSLDQGQSPDQLVKTLDNIIGILDRWEAAKTQYGAQPMTSRQGSSSFRVVEIK